SEQDREHHHGQERVDRSGAGQTDRAAAPALGEHGGDRAERGDDGHEVEQGGDQRDQDAAEDGHEQDEREDDYDRDEQREFPAEGVGEVDRGGGLAADVH